MPDSVTSSTTAKNPATEDERITQLYRFGIGNDLCRPVADEFPRFLLANDQGGSQSPRFEFRWPSIEVVRVGCQDGDPSSCQQIGSAYTSVLAERAGYGACGYLKQTAHLNKRQQLIDTAQDILVAFRVRNHRSNLLLEQPGDKLVGTDRNMTVRKLEQHDAFPLPIPQVRDMPLAHP